MSDNWLPLALLRVEKGEWSGFPVCKTVKMKTGNSSGRKMFISFFLYLLLTLSGINWCVGICFALEMASSWNLGGTKSFDLFSWGKGENPRNSRKSTCWKSENTTIENKEILFPSPFLSHESRTYVRIVREKFNTSCVLLLPALENWVWTFVAHPFPDFAPPHFTFAPKHESASPSKIQFFCSSFSENKGRRVHWRHHVDPVQEEQELPQGPQRQSRRHRDLHVQGNQRVRLRRGQARGHHRRWVWPLIFDLWFCSWFYPSQLCEMPLGISSRIVALYFLNRQ